MAWHLAVYDLLVQTALASLVLLAAAAAAVPLIGQPARKIRVIELALVGLLLLPLLLLLPGYPRLAVLPDLAFAPATIDQRSSSEGNATAPIVELPSPVEPAPLAAELSAQRVEETLPDEVAAESETEIVASASEMAPPDRAETLEKSREPQTEMSAASAAGRDFRFWIVAAYLGGVALMVLWSLLGLAAVARLVRSARPASEACRAMPREIAGPAGDRIGLLVSAKAGQPCAVAWRPPAIVLPESLAAEADARQLRWVLAHEWSHVARGDVWSWSLSGLVRWVFYYQPLVWWLRRRLQLCQDFVADAEAARLAASAEDYAEFLTCVSSRYVRPALAPGLGIGGGESELTWRVVMLVENDRPLEVRSPRHWNLAALPIALVLVGLLAALAQRPSGNAAEPAADPPKIDAAVAPTREPATAETPPERSAAQPADARPTVAGEARRPPDASIDMKIEEDSIVIRDTQKLMMLTEGLRRIRQKNPPDSAAIDKVSAMIREAEERIEKRKKELRPWVVAQLSDESANSANKIRPWDLLSIEIIVSPHEDLLDKHVVFPQALAAGMLELEPRPKKLHEIQRDWRVQPDGDISLGPICGRVPVAGLTEVEAEAAIAQRLAKTFTRGETKVQVARSKSGQPRDTRPAPFRLQVGDQIEIEAVATAPDARLSRIETVHEQGVRLGARYGRVNLVGLMPRVAEEAVRVHLQDAFGDPKVAIVLHVPKQSDYAVPRGATTGLPVGSLVSKAPALANDKSVAPAQAYSVTAVKTPGPPGTLLEPLDTIEVLLPLKPKMHKQMINGKLMDVYSGEMPQFSGTYVVEPDGDLALPHGYGRVKVGGLSERHAGAAIRKQLTDKLFTRTALPAVQVTRRGRAVFEGEPPAAGYRVRSGDKLLIGDIPQIAFEHLVDKEGNITTWAPSPKKPRAVAVAGLTLAEAQQALLNAGYESTIGGGVVGGAGTAAIPGTIYLTLGGWREEADPEVVARLEGDEKTQVQRLEREMRELKEMIRELKAK